MRLFMISLIFLSICNLSFAQLLNIPRIGNEVMKENKYVDYDGTPYLYPSWKSGIIVDKSGKIYPNQQLKYDSYKDQIEINQEGNTLTLNNSVYTRFEMSFIEENSNNTIHRIFQSGFNIDKYSSRDYFEVLYNDSIKFLKKYKTEFMEETVNSYGSGGKVKRFLIKEKYFIVNRDGIVKEFKINRKSFLDAITVNKDSALNYVEKYKVKIKTEKDIVMILLQI